MQPDVDQPCALCGTVSPCSKTDSGSAQYFNCQNDNCGPSEIVQGARSHFKGFDTALNKALSQQAAQARRQGMVLRVWHDYETGQLRHDLKSPTELE